MYRIVCTCVATWWPQSNPWLVSECMGSIHCPKFRAVYLPQLTQRWLSFVCTITTVYSLLFHFGHTLYCCNSQHVLVSLVLCNHHFWSAVLTSFWHCPYVANCSFLTTQLSPCTFLSVGSVEHLVITALLPYFGTPLFGSFSHSSSTFYFVPWDTPGTSSFLQLACT